MARWATRLLAAVFVLGLFAGRTAGAAQTTIAVAANFTAAAEELAASFEERTGHDVRLSFGSTGKLYAQILSGAPFDAFLAADAERPEMLEADGRAVANSRFTYAIGKLVLWSREEGLTGGGDLLREGDFGRLAIANPKTAPYGAAAVQALRALGVWDKVKGRIVQGDSIAQAHQFVATGNARFGLVALAQVALSGKGSAWVVPQELYSPIAQQAVLLKRDNAAASAFLAFLRGDEAKAIIARYGYGTE